MTSKTQRAQTIRPTEGAMLQPMYGDGGAPGEVETEEVEQKDGVVPMREQDQNPDEEWPKMGDREGYQYGHTTSLGKDAGQNRGANWQGGRVF